MRYGEPTLQGRAKDENLPAAMLWPLGLLVLVILGIVWLVRAVGRPRGITAAPPLACPGCGQE